MERRQFIGGATVATAVALAGCGFSRDGPTAVARQYLQALADNDSDRKGALSHEDAESLPVGSTEMEITITRVEEATIADVADERDIEADELRDLIEAEVEEIGADDFAIVAYDIETEDGEETGGFLWLVRDDGWKAYELL
jgi:ketosteroid isomerase-like protein